MHPAPRSLPPPAPHTAQEDLLDILPDLPEQQPKAEPAVTTALAQQPAPAQLENIESPELPEEEKSATGLSALPIAHNDPTAQADIPPEQTTFAPGHPPACRCAWWGRYSKPTSSPSATMSFV